MPISTALIIVVCLMFLLRWHVYLQRAAADGQRLIAEMAARSAGDAQGSGPVWLQRSGFSPQRPSMRVVTGSQSRRLKPPPGEVVAALKKVWLFADLSGSNLEQIARIATRRSVAYNEVIVRQGERDSADLYCVLHGYFKVMTHGSHGREVLINIVQRGECFGEIAFLDKQGRSATVTALDDGELLVIPRKDIEPLLHSDPKIALGMLTAQVRVVRTLTERAEDNAFLDERARLAKRLVALADHFGTRLGPHKVELNVRLSPQDLGDMVQVVDTRIDRWLEEWNNQGLIHRAADHRLVIVDRQRLQALAAGMA